MPDDKITAKLDVTKIEKARLYVGKKGTYLDLILIPTPNSPYGDDFMVCQSVSREERAAGVRGAALGNARFIRSQQRQAPAPAQRPSRASREYHVDHPSQPEPPTDGLDDDDIPF